MSDFEKRQEQTECGRKIARYAQIIGLCGLELFKERSKAIHKMLIGFIFALTEAIDREVAALMLNVEEKIS